MAHKNNAPADSYWRRLLAPGGPLDEAWGAPRWVDVGANSSNVAALRHVEDETGTGLLGVRFHNGGEYLYYGVPAHVYRQLLEAGSHGEEHWASVRRAGYSYFVVTPPRKQWRQSRP